MAHSRIPAEEDDSRGFIAIAERIEARHAALRLHSKAFQTFGTHGYFDDAVKAGCVRGLDAHVGMVEG